MHVAAELRRRGHEVIVFTRAPAEPNPEQPDVPVVGVEHTWPTRIAHAIARRIATGRFTNVIIQYTPQMWDVSRFGSPALPMLVRYLAKLRLPVALVIHEPYTPWASRPDLAVGAALLRAQLAMTIRASQPHFVTTELRRGLMAGVFSAAGAAPPHVLRVGPNAIPAPPQSSPDGHRIGLFSTLALGKRFDVVIDAFDEMSGTFPDSELVLIGDFGAPGNPASRALNDRIKRSPNSSRIQLTGKLPLAGIARIIATLNLYLFPMNTGANTRSSTLPVALASGIPVVAVRGPDTDDVFTDGDNVVFADRLDGPSFAAAAMRILTDPVLAGRISAGGRRLYDEQLSWPRIVDSLLDALDS